MRSWQCRGGGGSIGSCFNNNAVELSKRCSLTFVCDALYEGTSFVRTTTRRVCHRVRYIRIERHNLCFFLARSLSFVVLPATVEGAKNPQGNRDVVNGHGHVPLPGRTCQSSCNVRMPSETHAALLPKHTSTCSTLPSSSSAARNQPWKEREGGHESCPRPDVLRYSSSTAQKFRGFVLTQGVNIGVGGTAMPLLSSLFLNWVRQNDLVLLLLLGCLSHLTEGQQVNYMTRGA